MCNAQLRVGGSFIVTCQQAHDAETKHHYEGTIQGYELDLWWKEPGFRAHNFVKYEVPNKERRP